MLARKAGGVFTAPQVPPVQRSSPSASRSTTTIASTGGTQNHPAPAPAPAVTRGRIQSGWTVSPSRIPGMIRRSPPSSSGSSLSATTAEKYRIGFRMSELLGFGGVLEDPPQV